MKPSGIGGQAVIEGVMMKNGNKYAVAVRKPNNEIVIETGSPSEKSYVKFQRSAVREVLKPAPADK